MSSGPDDRDGGANAWRRFGQLAVERIAALHRSRARERGPLAGFANTDNAIGAVLDDGVGEPSGESGLLAAVEAARSHFAISLGAPYPFSSIVSNARLDHGSAMLLAIAVACELDSRLGRLVGYVQDDLGRPRLTLQTIDELMRDHNAAVADVLGMDSPLRRAAFVEIIEDGPWAQHTLVVHPGVIWALAGDSAIDPLIPSDTRVIECDENLDPDDRGNDLADHLVDDLVVVTGDDRILRRREAARRAAASRFLVCSQPTDPTVWNALVREATLSGMGIIVELEDSLSVDGRTIISRANHLAWALSSRQELAISDMPNRPWREVHVAKREPSSQDWDAAIGPVDPHGHRLSPEQLDLVGRVFRAHGGDLDGAVRRLTAGPLDQLAQRIRPSRGWDDIVLSKDRLDHLRGIVDRYRFASTVFDQWGFSAQPSRGLVALFSGPSGTGKTLAAEIVAGELGLDVFKLNLSAVVSKYIGETEKNLEQIFDAAGSGNVVLFFDEADSLFGKRSEVKDARDRYANIEVSYLLQRLERYEGVVLLATNFEKNVDEAFLRRIHARIEFPMPGVDERRQIWVRNFPPTAPVDSLDFDFLANHFEMPGGAIRNAAVHSAFLAAAVGQHISMRQVVQAVAREYRKMGRLLKPEHFGQYFDLVKEAE